MIFPFLLCALFQSDGVVTLDAAHRRGIPLAFAVHADEADETVAWMAEGSALHRFDVSSTAAVLDEAVAVDAMTLAILSDESAAPVQRLFVAGGPLGLVKVEDDGGTWSDTITLDDGSGVAPCAAAGQRWCTDVGLLRVGSTPYLVASFGAKGVGSTCNELRFYDLMEARGANAPIAAVATVALSAVTGTSRWPVAWSLAVQDDRDEVYVAVGTAGLVRVTLTPANPGPGLNASVSQPFAIPITDLPFHADLTAEPTFPDADARFLDVAVTDRAVYAAADAAGLVEIPFGAFPPPTANDWTRYSVGEPDPDDLGSYAVHVAVTEPSTGPPIVAVHGNLHTAQARLGHPTTPFGTMSALGQPGGGHKSPPSKNAIVVFEEQPAGLSELGGQDFPPGTDLPRAIYDLAVRRDAATGDVLVYADQLHRYRVDPSGPDAVDFAVVSTGGNVTTDGLALLADPDVMIFGQDHGAEFTGALVYDGSTGAISEVPNTRYTEDDDDTDSCVDPCEGPGPSVFVGGIWEGDQWPVGGGSTFQWMLQGKGRTYVPGAGGCLPACSWAEQTGPAYEISRFEPDPQDGQSWSLDWWQLPSPVDPDGRRGGSYFSGHYDPSSGLVFMVRSSTRWGLLYARRADIESGHGSLSNGSLLSIPVQQVATHTDDVNPLTLNPQLNTPDPGVALTYNVRAFDWEPGGGAPGERALAVATGHTGPLSVHGENRSKLSIFRMSSIVAGKPQLDRVLALGPPEGMCAAVAFADLDPSGGSDPRTFAFVTDFGGRLLVYDLQDLFTSAVISAPSVVYDLGDNAFDGQTVNLMDIELVSRNGKVLAYLSTWKRGLTVLDVTDPLAPFEVAGSPILVPGMCQALSLRRDPSIAQPPATDLEGVPVSHVIVSDHFASAQLYSW